MASEKENSKVESKEVKQDVKVNRERKTKYNRNHDDFPYKKFFEMLGRHIRRLDTRLDSLQKHVLWLCKVMHYNYLNDTHCLDNKFKYPIVPPNVLNARYRKS